MCIYVCVWGGGELEPAGLEGLLVTNQTGTSKIVTVTVLKMEKFGFKEK